MSSRSQPDRTPLLRSKHEQLHNIIISRKRRLREAYAVFNTVDPVPAVSYASFDQPPDNAEEQKFLDLADITQHRIFDEQNLPKRRKLRSDTAKSRSPTGNGSFDVQNGDSIEVATWIQGYGSTLKKNRASTPVLRNEGGHGEGSGKEGSRAQGTPMQRSTSKGSQTDLPAESSAVLNEIVEETFKNASCPRPPGPDSTITSGDVESERIGSLASRPNSTGVDTRKAMPILGEDAARLIEPLVDGLTSHVGPPHKAVSVHLPPREVQEQYLAEERQHRKHLAINLPPRDRGRGGEPLSSPGSTTQSATTPALHDASTDTSPDHENRFDGDGMDVEPKTPAELDKLIQDTPQHNEYDRNPQAQMAVNRNEILGSSPITPEEQLQLEGRAATQRPTLNGMPVAVFSEENSSSIMTKGAHEAVQVTVDDNTEPARLQAYATDRNVAGMANSSQQAAARLLVIPDSEAKSTPPADAMDIDEESAPKLVNGTTKSRSETQHSSIALPSASTASNPPKDSLSSSTPTTEKMTTRVGSGAMKARTVSEILGGTSEPNTNTILNNHANASKSAGVERSGASGNATPQVPGRKSLVQKEAEKQRTKLSQVVFAKQSPPKQKSTKQLVHGHQMYEEADQDYFVPLFLASTAAELPDRPSLDSLLSKAHKTISTENAYLPILENQSVRVLQKIYKLQASGKWALRQPKRSEEPQRSATHWDTLLEEAKWMRTDFRQERKWKMTVARNLAYACAEWHDASPEDRKKIQVKASSPPKEPLGEPHRDVDIGDISSDAQATPELVASADIGSLMDEDEIDESRLDLPDTVAPYAIFGLQDDDVVFGLQNSPTTNQLLAELPMYGKPLEVPSSEPPSISDLNPDRAWRREAVPLSKYVDGRMEVVDNGPPRKKSRFEYDEESEDDEAVFEHNHKRPILPPEIGHVALFDPAFRIIRDRIHAGHQFRPPSEFPMPLQNFFENRLSSQWTQQEDDDLRKYTKDFSYNWSLIALLLQSKSCFTSGAERRSPWECFERWVSLEGLPGDMAKTHYFRAYTGRVDAANRAVAAAAAIPQQPNGNGQLQPPRRRTTASIKVERRRTQKHLTLVDAMRKLAKKREGAAQKQQQAAALAASRKAPEPGPRANLKTPMEFSKIKHEQMEKMKENLIMSQQRQEAQRRAVMQQRQLQQNSGVLVPPNGQQPPRPPGPNGSQPPNGSNGMPNPSGHNLQVPGQNRPRGNMPAQMGNQGMQGRLQPPQPSMNGIPQAPMQGMQGQMPLPNLPLDVGLVSQAQSIQQQQRQAIQMKQQGHLPGSTQTSPPRSMNGMSPPIGFQQQMQNSNMTNYATNANGNVSSPGNIQSPQTLAGSPGPGMAQNPQPMNQLERQIRSQFPNATNEQIMLLIKDEVSKNVRRQAQAAMASAAGPSVNVNTGNGMLVPNNIRLPVGTENSPQMYAQLLRQQQETQQRQQQQLAAQQVNTHQRTPSVPGNGTQ
ncbi:hypothetical protein BJ878DRAFT_278820 [Calycina marina]|uniref:Vacuolar import and degradation protein 21 n=1 Tax=Calycina marina TaxID=1763456 RepID=A0A9P7YV80_9HELO|nr:hypothetical protein BJ878DRAFT_278820 [Calycina marina]